MSENWKTFRDQLDCGDNSCKYAKEKTGQRTNGGCTCHNEFHFRNFAWAMFWELTHRPGTWKRVEDGLPEESGGSGSV